MTQHKLFCGDAAEVLAGFKPDSIHLTVTSPPYDNLRTYKGFTFNFEKIAHQLYRVTRPGGVVVWVVADATIKGSETGTSFKQALYFKELGFNLHDTMIYEKAGCSMPSNRYLSAFEYMFILSKGRPATINFICDRKNRFTTRWGKGKKVRNRDGTFSLRPNREIKEWGRRFNIWRYANGGQGYGATDTWAHQHPATFPEALARDHILSWSDPGAWVLDPMVGGGTTGKMARLLDRNFVGIDISQEYIDLTEKRIMEATK